jgi:transglutaminase-like putative cysteine protease
VAWDGAAFVWHAWAEVRSAGTWVPVDPSFGQLPARGPRFTVGRFGPDDLRTRDEAGARILACWGTARVEDR